MALTRRAEATAKAYRSPADSRGGQKPGGAPAVEVTVTVYETGRAAARVPLPVLALSVTR